ncbi:hypothetical protein V496_02136 [Pseudogymnoascus sp. VKM F-4515 (FW-2607)]|nr:hypothetical protein V496_02136 [Pseudogymnoascus sp. VKM F-4515 (FW-2607)]
MKSFLFLQGFFLATAVTVRAQTPRQRYTAICNSLDGTSKTFEDGYTITYFCKKNGIASSFLDGQTTESPDDSWLYTSRECQLYGAGDPGADVRATVFMRRDSPEEGGPGDSSCTGLEHALEDCEANEAELTEELEECRAGQLQCRHDRLRLDECNDDKEGLEDQLAHERQTCRARAIAEERAALPKCPAIHDTILTVGGKRYRAWCNHRINNGITFYKQNDLRFNECLEECSQEAQCKSILWFANAGARCKLYNAWTDNGQLTTTMMVSLHQLVCSAQQRGYNGCATAAIATAQRLSQPKWGKAVPGTRGVLEREKCYYLRAAPNNPVAHLGQAQSRASDAMPPTMLLFPYLAKAFMDCKDKSTRRWVQRGHLTINKFRHIVDVLAMTELSGILDDIGLTQYLHSFLEHGFDTWDNILDITDDVLGVKLGHRRRLQRTIAEARGISQGHQALVSPKRRTCALDDKLPEEGKGVTTPRSDSKDGSSSTHLSGKRKYRKHPKPNLDAPTRPRSAYVIFSNKMREDLKGRSLSFTEVAKLAGRSWQHLTASEKEPYEQQAFDAKEKCAIEFAKYRQTESYKAYSEYLLGFNAEQPHIQEESSQEASNESSKVPKLANIPTASSTSPAKSTTASSVSHGAPYDTRTQGPSSAFLRRPWVLSEHAPQTEMASSQGQTYVGRPSTTMTGYGDTVIGANSHSRAWMDHSRPTDISVPRYSRKVLNCENCGIIVRQSHEEKPIEPSANMTLGTPSRDLADTTTISAIVSTSVLSAHDGHGGSQRPYSAYHVESSGYSVHMSGIEESIEKGSAGALHVAHATSNRSRGFGSSMTIPTQVSSLDTNLATHVEEQISLNSAVHVSIEDKSRPGEGWTEVTDDVLLIRHLIDLYFCWEHPITSSLMKTPFLRDFSQGKRRHCSSLLINAMSALACRFSDRPEVRSDPKNGDTIGDHFFMEAKRLLQSNMPSCLTTIQALGLMSIREASCGRESTGYFYSCQSIRMATELGLHQDFDRSRLVFSTVESEVRSVTFWAAFVLDSTWSLLVGRVPQIARRAVSAVKPAIFEEEEEKGWVPYTDAGIQTGRTYKQRSNIVSVFRSLCEISEIINDTLYLLYAPGGHLTSRKILGAYELYLDWYNALLIELRLAKNYTPAVLYIHMYYHSANLLLFQPFLKLRFLGSAFSPLGICVQSAENIYSLLQTYRQLYSLRRASSFLPYLVLISGVNILIHGSSRMASDYTVQNFGDLKDMSYHHGFAFRSLDILRYFARHWGIFLPSSFGIAGAPPNAAELCPPSNSSLNFFCPRLTSALRTVADTMEDLFSESKQQTLLFLPFPYQGAPLLFDEAFASGVDSDQSKETQLRLDGHGSSTPDHLQAKFVVDGQISRMHYFLALNLSPQAQRDVDYVKNGHSCPVYTSVPVT